MEGGHVEIFTKCKGIVSQQAEFLCRNEKHKLTYCQCCKERWFGTEMMPRMSMCSRCDTCEKLPPNIFHFFKKKTVIYSQKVMIIRMIF